MSTLEKLRRAQSKDRSARGFSALKPSGGENLNPLSSRGQLSGLGFFAYLLGVIGLTLIGTLIIHRYLEPARQNRDEQLVWTIYGVWIAMTCVGFFFLSNAMIKRWSMLLGWHRLPLILRLLCRMSLLSPIFSIFSVGLTLLHTGSSGRQSFLSLMASASSFFVLFHVGWLAFGVQRGELVFGPGAEVHLPKRMTPVQQSVEQILPSEAPTLILPGEAFQVHLYPYLSPSLRYGVNLLSDVQRVWGIAKAIKNDRASVCPDRTQYLGAKVDNCFLSNYFGMAEVSPFMTSIMGFFLESRYRQNPKEFFGEYEATPHDGHPLNSLSQNLLFVSNVVSLMEGKGEVRDFQELFEPAEFIELIGSPEIPVFQLLGDFQRYMLVTRVIPALEDQLKNLEEQMVAVESDLSFVFAPVLMEVSTLKARMKALEKELFRTPLSSR